MPNPKLEIYRFQLNPRNEEGFKTFRDFAQEITSLTTKPSDDESLEACFKHFMDSLQLPVARDNSLKKRIALIEDVQLNKHLSKRPRLDKDKKIIHGVINGGRFGLSRILDNPDDTARRTEVVLGDSVMSYFYFLLYVPPDHNEGCFILQSNGLDESVTRIFRHFVARIFKSKSFNMPNCEPFSPKAFQQEFRDAAVIKSIAFKESYVPNIIDNQGIEQTLGEFVVTIKAVPKNEDVPLGLANQVKNFLETWRFGKANDEKTLNEFDEAKLEAKYLAGDSTKTFEWIDLEEDFIPVIKIKKQITEFNEDGTPSFTQVEALCIKYFTENILPELRPDNAA